MPRDRGLSRADVLQHVFALPMRVTGPAPRSAGNDHDNHLDPSYHVVVKVSAYTSYCVFLESICDAIGVSDIMDTFPGTVPFTRDMIDKIYVTMANPIIPELAMELVLSRTNYGAWLDLLRRHRDKYAVVLQLRAWVGNLGTEGIPTMAGALPERAAPQMPVNPVNPGSRYQTG